jgi:hypothetical protein
MDAPIPQPQQTAQTTQPVNIDSVMCGESIKGSVNLKAVVLSVSKTYLIVLLFVSSNL